MKRRTVARELCEGGRVLVNEHQAKPAKELKQGDSIVLQFSTRWIELEVLSIPAGPARKSQPQDLYRVRSERRILSDNDSWNKNP